MGATPPFFVGADMLTFLTFAVALAFLGMAHVFVVVQLEPGSTGIFLVPPIYIAFALDVLALLLVYWL